MADDPITVENLRLEYRVPRHRSNSFKETAVRIVRRGIQFDRLLAVNDVSFGVAQGEVLGIVGPNGAGKSTLMKVLARVLPPTSGRVRVRGRVSPLIELGAGFNFEQTARENIVLNGALLGRDAKVMKHRCLPIVDWAGLTDYLDVPVRTFSSGMVARLAFAIAVDVEPDILLIDEILAVGDEAFKKKSAERLDDLINGGAAGVLVSHQMTQVVERCARAIWLDRGRVRMTGEPLEVTEAYAASVQEDFEQAHAD